MGTSIQARKDYARAMIRMTNPYTDPYRIVWALVGLAEAIGRGN